MPRSLTAYRHKRRAQSTPEPFGGVTTGDCLRFVVQQHDATRMHYDFRLEWRGVLLSWAVPRGPSVNPKDKRLAVHVEDHPLDYTTFEGVIPAGNYGAGPVVVWDYGRWTPLEDIDVGLKSGKLLFELFGYKLRGVWTLVLPKKNERDWLLIKKPDHGAGVAIDEASVLSGLTVNERLAGGRDVKPPKALAKQPAFTESVDKVGLMLARRAPAPFNDPQWLFEIKYDGFRMLARKEGSTVQLRYRRGIDATGLYPEVARAIASLPQHQLVLDGEIVVHDAQGMPAFGPLQDRAMLSDARAITRAALASPATLYVFDTLAWEGRDMRALPLSERKAWLDVNIPRVGPLHYVDHVLKDGKKIFEHAQRLGLEGLMAKRISAPYRAGRTDDWLKLPVYLQDTFTVVGYTLPRGARQGIGALQVAERGDDGALAYVGAVGSGMDDATLATLYEALGAAHIAKPACKAVPDVVKAQWVAPRIDVLVRYKERTRDGSLRQPVFIRVDMQLRAAPDAAAPRDVKWTHTEKIFWPQSKHTKGDLLTYYKTIAPIILPYLRDRPVVLTRYPDGIDGKSFFQKDAPTWSPTWLRTVSLWSEEKQRDIAAFVCDDVDALCYLANMGTIPLHIWSSRIGALGQPDFCILDLDPKETPFSKVIEVAVALRRLCEECELPAFVKTSGSTGLHILIPLSGALTHEQSRQFAGLLGSVIVKRLPKIATMERLISKRKHKIYIDTLQNGHGKLIVAPYCVRPVPGALVSTPLKWSEVTAKLDFKRFSIDTVPKRMVKLKEDPLAPLLTTRPALLPALNHLSTLLD